MPTLTLELKNLTFLGWKNEVSTTGGMWIRENKTETTKNFTFSIVLCNVGLLCNAVPGMSLSNLGINYAMLTL